jgi:hypothetical protein
MKPFRFRLLGAAVLVALCATTALAQTAADTPEARKAAAEQLIRNIDDLMGPEKMAQSVRGAMQAPMLEGLRSHPRLTDAQRQRAAQLMGEDLGAVVGEMMVAIKPGLYAAMTSMYVERFSLAEIQELDRFYANPTVRKATLLGAEEMPRLMQPMMGALQQWGPRIQERANATIAKLKAEGIDISPPGQQPPARPQPPAAQQPSAAPQPPAAKPGAKKS